MSQCLICCEMLEDESFKQKWIWYVMTKHESMADHNEDFLKEK
jgi:hypothetical protein